MNKELYVVDDNGIVVDTITSEDKYVKLSEGDKVVRKGVIQYLSDTTDIKYRFIKVNPVAWAKVANKYPIMNTLIYYLGYMDNVLSYTNGKIIRSTDIYKICGVSESTAKRQLKGLQTDDVIHKVKDKNRKMNYYVVNPYICMRGRKIYLSLYEEFKLSVWRGEVEEWEK